jgi:hypothetical protein
MKNLMVFIGILITTVLLASCQGAIGPVGAKGDKGDVGSTGLQGQQGVKGDKGDIGEQGLKGDKGDKGDQGAIGPQGIQGEVSLSPPISDSEITVIVYHGDEHGNYTTIPSLADGMPCIRNGDNIHIYGAGFKLGETIILKIADVNHNFDIGVITITNNAGIFHKEIHVNWQNYNWADRSMLFGCIKAIGDINSQAVAFVGIWAR